MHRTRAGMERLYKGGLVMLQQPAAAFLASMAADTAQCGCPAARRDGVLLQFQRELLQLHARFFFLHPREDAIEVSRRATLEALPCV
jgi:hypothetical protein